MTFRPENKTKKELTLSLICGIAAALLFVISGMVSKYVVVYQISALIIAVLGVEVYVKYIANDYVYEATDKELKVYRITGKKSICIASLDYEMSLSDIIHADEYNENKNRFPKADFNVNYAKNLKPKDYYVYFFEFNGKKTMMKFEPDKVFADYANEKLNIAYNGEK